MDSLFGEGTSLPVRFFIAFVVVFALIGVTAWLIRRFGSGALGGTGARGRAPRLAVIEAGAVDGRRKLVLIRRDNIEHLIMIGGPTDIVVESNIVRGQSPRDAATSRVSSAAETLPRTLPAEETAWPLQPEAAPRPARSARPAPLEDSAHWTLPPEPVMPAPPVAPKRSRSADTLAGLAAELSVRPADPVVAAPAPRSAPAIETPRARPEPAATPVASDQNLADMASRLEAALRRPQPAPAPAPRPAPAPKPAAEAPRATPPAPPPAAPEAPPAAAAKPVPQKPPKAAPPVAPPVAPPAPPVAQAAVPAAAPATAPVAVATSEAQPAEPKDATAAPKPEAKPEPKADEKPEAKPDDVFGSIEQEMANLLGRPSGKPS